MDQQEFRAMVERYSREAVSIAARSVLPREEPKREPEPATTVSNEAPEVTDVMVLEQVEVPAPAD